MTEPKNSQNTKAAKKPMVAYLTQRFPSLTITFIYREVMALRQGGLNLATFSIWPPRENEVSAEAQHLVGTTYYIFPIAWLAFLWAHMYYLFTRPAKYLGTFFYVLTRPNMKLSHRRRTFFHFLYAVYMAAEVDRQNIQHIHVHFALHAATVAMIIGRLLGITFSVTAHANDIFDDPVLLKEKLEDARFVVTISEYNKQYLQKFVSPDKIHIVHYGLDLQQFTPLPAATNGKTPIIFSIGRLVEKKGFPYLIQACEILAKQGYNFKCKIVGDGPQREMLQHMITTAQLEDVVSLEGAVLQEHMLDYWQEATVFALPCVIGEDGDRDGMPNVLIEAMALQIPPVTTTLVGIPEFIRHGYSGLLAPPHDARTLADLLGEILNNPAQRNMLGQNARLAAEKYFDLYHNVDQLFNLYNEIGNNE